MIGAHAQDPKRHTPAPRRSISKAARAEAAVSASKTHEIDPLTGPFGQKVFQSYLDRGDTADRLYWVYGPERGEITVVGLEPPPEDRKRGGYERVSLSGLASGQ